MAAQDYEAIADRAEALLLDLLPYTFVSVDEAEIRATVKGLQPALNTTLHEEYPDFAAGGVRIAAASPVPSQQIPLSILLEMIDHGVRVGRWTVDYDGRGCLQRRAGGYLRAQRDNDGVLRCRGDDVAQ